MEHVPMFRSQHTSLRNSKILPVSTVLYPAIRSS